MTTTALHRILDERLAALLAVLLAAGGLALANFGGEPSENGGAGAFFATLALTAALAAFVFVFALPRAASPGRAATVLAVLAVLALPAFWSGVGFVFGVGAIYAGARAGRVAPVVVGAAVLALTLAGCAFG